MINESVLELLAQILDNLEDLDAVSLTLDESRQSAAFEIRGIDPVWLDHLMGLVSETNAKEIPQQMSQMSTFSRGHSTQYLENLETIDGETQIDADVIEPSFAKTMINGARGVAHLLFGAGPR